MRPEERTDLAHCQRNPFLRSFQENAHFRLRLAHRAFHGDHVRVRFRILRQDQSSVAPTPFAKGANRDYFTTINRRRAQASEQLMRGAQ